MNMQVLLKTKFGNLWRWSYEANKPDSYGNSNEVVIAHQDGPYSVVFFN
jgi:hypothetical protein